MFCQIGDRIKFIGNHQASGISGIVVKLCPKHTEPARLSPLNGAPDDLFEDTSSTYYPDAAVVKLDHPAPSSVPGSRPIYFPIQEANRDALWKKGR